MSKNNALNINSSKNIFYIKFYPGLKSSLGCEKATLILGRLEYWFERYSTGFYKFVEPCQHPLYREGDSWAEEIGFSRKIFAKAFDLIGVRYKSKSAFTKATDKFQGKLYASYHDRKTNQTYFIRNHQFAPEFINRLFCRKSPSPALNKKKAEDQKIVSINPKVCVKKGRSRSVLVGRSFGGTIGGKENKPIQRNTSSLESCSSQNKIPSSELVHKTVTEEMINVWKEEVGELGISSISNGLLNKLFDSLKRFFNESIDAWKTYCRLISSSKFLMGEAQNKFFKKAWITWAIKEETIARVRGGGFKFGDRQTKVDKKIQDMDQGLNVLELNKKRTEGVLDSIKLSLKQERAKKVRKEIQTFSEEQIEKFKQEFEKNLEEENNSLTAEFNRAGWEGLFIQTYFDSYLKEEVGGRLFTNSLEEEIQQRVQPAGLSETLKSLSDDICKLRTKRQCLLSQNNQVSSQ